MAKGGPRDHSPPARTGLATPHRGAEARTSFVDQAGERRSARIESLRAVAALLVLSGHVFGYAHGYRGVVYSGFFNRARFGGGFGVFLFFTLSGYLLYLPFARYYYGFAVPGGAPSPPSSERRGPPPRRRPCSRGKVDLPRYARNRALRILPLYYVVVVVLLLVQEHGGTAEQWWRFLLFAESFSSRTVGRMDGPMWSLVVELHFYVLLPLLAAALAAGRASERRAALVLAVLGAASFAVAHATVHRGLTWRYSLPTTFYYFAAGMLLALARLAWARRGPRALRGPLARSGWWLAAAGAIWLATWWRYQLTPLLAVAGFLTVGACVLPLRPGALVGVLEWRPLALVGVVSYSLYLWHLPIVDALSRTGWAHGYTALLAVSLPVCLAVAAVSYLVVEAPFLRLRSRWAPPSPTAEPPRTAAKTSPEPVP